MVLGGGRPIGGGQCVACGKTFGPNVWDLVEKRGACPHCGGQLEAAEAVPPEGVPDGSLIEPEE